MKPTQGEVLVPPCIALTSMLPAISLDHNLVFKTDEVHDPRANWNLAAELHMREPTRTQQTPQYIFGVSRIAP
jgi:hypothetical protein